MRQMTPVKLHSLSLDILGIEGKKDKKVIQQLGFWEVIPLFHMVRKHSPFQVTWGRTSRFRKLVRGIKEQSN